MGDADPASWRYSFKQYSDRTATTRSTLTTCRRAMSPTEGMVHVRYMPPHDAPWRGISPLVRAGVTAGQLANIERKPAVYDAQGPSGYYIPLPHGGSSARR